MRFAGSKLEDFLGKGTDFGLVTKAAGGIRSNDAVSSIKRQGEAVGRGIGAAGDIARAEYDAQAGVVGAQTQANTEIMSTIGGVLSEGFSSLPKMGKGGTGSNYGGSHYAADFVSVPSGKSLSVWRG